MATTCPHGLPQSECLNCPTLPDRQGQKTVTRGSHGRLHLATAAVAIILIGVVAWLVAGVVFAVLHVLELIAVAVVAAWGGYRLGHWRGTHQRR